MQKQDRFSINIAEIRCIESDGKNIEEWQHSFLCLVRETQEHFDPKRVTAGHISDQLHFSPIRGSYRPEIRRNIDLSIRGRFGRTKLFPMLGGYESGIMPVWAHMVSYGEQLVRSGQHEFGQDPRYDSHSINCRSYVRAALNAIGLELYTDFTTSSAGMFVLRIFKDTPYDHGLVIPSKEL